MLLSWRRYGSSSRTSTTELPVRAPDRGRTIISHVYSKHDVYVNNILIYIDMLGTYIYIHMHHIASTPLTFDISMYNTMYMYISLTAYVVDIP